MEKAGYLSQYLQKFSENRALYYPDYVGDFDVLIWETTFLSLCFPYSTVLSIWICDQGLTIKQSIVAFGEAKWKSFFKAPPKSNGWFHMATNYAGYTEVINSIWFFYDECWNN